MNRSWQFLFNGLIVMALLCGAVLVHYASGSRAIGVLSAAGAALALSTPVQNATSNRPDIQSPSATPTVSSPHNSAPVAASTRSIDSFHDWFQKYRAANSDTNQLRSELEA